MAVEKRDPIPPGTYWVDTLTPEAQESFHLWIRQFSPRVKALRTTETWRLFRVINPTPRWEGGTGLGLPTIAPRGKKTSKQDTVQRPEPPKGLLDDAGLPMGVLVLIGLYLWSKR